LRFFAVNYPNLLGGALNGLYRSIRWLILTRPAIKRIGRWLDAEDSKHPPIQESKKPHAERIQDLVNIFLDEPFRQGACGTVHEARLLSSLDWGFKLEDVSFGKVLIWHGVKDTNATIEMIRYMAERVPGSELMEFEGETHYTMWKHVEAALKRLVDEGGLENMD
jgi:pimeloyl-ACP methyl ester carboxylesterase